MLIKLCEATYCCCFFFFQFEFKTICFQTWHALIWSRVVPSYFLFYSISYTNNEKHCRSLCRQYICIRWKYNLCIVHVYAVQLYLGIVDTFVALAGLATRLKLPAYGWLVSRAFIFTFAKPTNRFLVGLSTIASVHYSEVRLYMHNVEQTHARSKFVRLFWCFHSKISCQRQKRDKNKKGTRLWM